MVCLVCSDSGFVRGNIFVIGVYGWEDAMFEITVSSDRNPLLQIVDGEVVQATVEVSTENLLRTAKLSTFILCPAPAATHLPLLHF